MPPPAPKIAQKIIPHRIIVRRYLNIVNNSFSGSVIFAYFVVNILHLIKIEDTKMQQYEAGQLICNHAVHISYKFSAFLQKSRKGGKYGEITNL